MIYLYSVRITGDCGEISYFTDWLGRDSFIRASALRIIQQLHLQGVSCDLVRN